MEQGKGTKSSSSSFPSDLFASKVSPSSPSRILDSIFPPQPKVPAGQSLVARRQDTPNEPSKTKPGSPGHEGVANEEVGSIYPEQFTQPCPLSSSIFYGGQDIYPLPKSNHGSGIGSVNKDDGEDYSGYASRGNWWQGSLYY